MRPGREQGLSTLTLLQTGHLSCFTGYTRVPPAALILPMPLLLALHTTTVQPGPRSCQAASTLPVQHLGTGAGAPGTEQSPLQVLRAVQLQAGCHE